FLEPLQNQPTDAHARLGHLDTLDGKAPFRIKVSIGGLEPEAALRNRADAPPFPVGDLEHVADQAESGRVAPPADRPGGPDFPRHAVPPQAYARSGRRLRADRAAQSR